MTKIDQLGRVAGCGRRRERREGGKRQGEPIGIVSGEGIRGRWRSRGEGQRERKKGVKNGQRSGERGEDGGGREEGRGFNPSQQS